MDYREFAGKIKSKYPDYADMDDRELAQKMVAKFPDYSDVTFDDQAISETPLEASPLDRAADISRKVQDAVIGPVAKASDTVARGLSKAAFMTDAPIDIAQKGLTAVAGAVEEGGEWIAEKGGELGYPKTGVALGLAAQQLPYMVPIGKAANINTKLAPFSGKPGIAARLKQMRTGVEASSFERLRRDPTAFFNPASRKEAGAAIGAAKQQAGVNMGVTDDISSLTKENLGKARNPMAAASKAQDAIADKISTTLESNPGLAPSEAIRSSGITADEAATALDGINKRLAKLERSEGAGSPSFQKWTAIKSHIQTVLDEVAPNVRAANSEFSRIALRDKFMEPMPVNQSGTMSKISTFGFTPAGAGVGAVAGGPVGAVIGAAAVQAARSPFLAGLGTATRGLIDKITDPALTATARGLSNRPLLLEYARRRQEDRP